MGRSTHNLHSCLLHLSDSVRMCLNQVCSTRIIPCSWCQSQLLAAYASSFPSTCLASDLERACPYPWPFWPATALRATSYSDTYTSPWSTQTRHSWGRAAVISIWGWSARAMISTGIWTECRSHRLCANGNPPMIWARSWPSACHWSPDQTYTP